MERSTITHLAILANTIIIVISVFAAMIVSDNSLRAEISKVRDEVGEVRKDIADIRAELAELRGSLNAHITGHQHGIADASTGGESQEPQN